MTLASFADANKYLDEAKVGFIDDADALPEATIADRIIGAMLFSAFPESVLWDIEPTDPQVATPQIVVEIAAMLMASYRYAKIYSEESTEPPAYAMDLRNQAYELLNKLILGQITIGEVISISAETMRESDFWPNNTTVDQDTLEPIRAFTMEMFGEP